MAKKIAGYIKLQIPAGQANPAPPVGPALGQHGVNIMDFCKQFNAKTQDQPGMIIPVVITVYADHSFSIKRPENVPYTGRYASEVKRVDDLPATPDDPYGIRAECAKHGLDVLAPTFLPEGFELYDYDYSESSVIDSKNMSFWFYRNESQVVQLIYSWIPESLPGGGIPSDQFNLHEIEVNGNPAIISEEDNQYTIIFYDGNLETIITTDSSYENGDKIVASLK